MVLEHAIVLTIQKTQKGDVVALGWIRFHRPTPSLLSRLGPTKHDRNHECIVDPQYCPSPIPAQSDGYMIREKSLEFAYKRFSEVLGSLQLIRPEDIPSVEIVAESFIELAKGAKVLVDRGWARHTTRFQEKAFAKSPLCLEQTADSLQDLFIRPTRVAHFL
jgi:hypothetical protein